MLKALDRFQPYFILGFVYLLANIGLRCIDFFLLAGMFNIALSVPLFLKGVLNDIIWCGCVFIVFIPVCFLLQKRFQRASEIVPSLIFGTLFLIQIILVIYAFFAGKLLDKEIFIRPFSEVYATVKSYGNIFLFLFLGIAFIISFSLISLYVAKKQTRNIRILSITAAIILLASVGMVSYPYNLYGRNTQNNRFIINRALYFIYEDINYRKIGLPLKSADPSTLKQFTSEHPQWQICDSLYPFYRNDNTPDVLSCYFNLGKEKPNIVFILVESLGRVISGKDAYSGSFTPFLDSLANHSLYWGNCISTSERSFGILPSILGSLPNGNTGFQFGDMPHHNSLIRLLRENGYKTNLFYAGYYEFDNVGTFMNMQGTDYLAPFYKEHEASGFKEKNANEWGYADEIMFEKSLGYLNTHSGQSFFNLFVTLTTHNDLTIPGKEKYINQARSINRQLNQQQQRRNNPHIDYLASFLYSDNALRKFFCELSKRPEFKNTIFVITGDHSIYNFGIPNRLSIYNIPLLIYSHLLKKPEYFESLVSVLDITPSLWSMLSSHYSFIKPQYVSWISDGLDTVKNFRSCKKVLLMQDNRDIDEFVYNNYFYSYDSVYSITNSLRLKPAPEKVASVVKEKFDLFNTIENYVYNNAKLMPDLINMTSDK